MRKMPLNQIAFGKTDAFNELNTFGQEYFMESFVANPKYHIDDFLSGSRFFVCGKKGTGKSALLKYLECHFLKDESNLVFPIRFKSEIEQVDKDSFEEIASAPDNSTKNEKYDTSSILDQSSYVLVWKTLSYSEDEVNAIFTLLNRITMPFTYEILSQRIAQLGKFYPRMPELLNSERLTQMLNKLYELGIIGNTGKPMNFVFLGRTALDLLGRMVIHTPLRNYFSVQYER